ncbi:hypothetical protein CP532_5182 [Ophiocordyceps camponoti-leonardi (nom. inval.)]|nr:hypothetical protein CP532_5182 [Ophiocordyceps camponoti-leonardi (nom. inval.)]
MSSSLSSSPCLSWPMAGDAPEPGPDTDRAKHPKGRRKRTAAKDKAILEEAYQNNPKPDKQARLAVVDRVSLNEKEVQIWFQNRRQNDRRKSRPLSPEEIAALRCNIPSLSRSFPSDLDGLAKASDSAQLSPPCGGQFASWISRRRADASPSTPGSSFPDSVGYLANRWNIGPSSQSCHDDSSMLQFSSEDRPKPTRSPSRVRLALSLEGKAELVSNQSSPARAIPSRPSSALPGPPQARRAGLQRSHSALPTITLPPISSLAAFVPPQMVRGRSRDVQAWESCADSEKRDQLTTQAEHESNGSAIAAISLIRSSSGVLQPGSAKRNASATRLRQTKRHKLGRSSSSKMEPESGKVKVAMLLSPNDSDKENWSPGEEDEAPRPQPRRRPLPSNAPPKACHSRRTGRVLEEQKRPGLLCDRANTAPSGLTSLTATTTTTTAAAKTTTKTTSNGSCDIYEDSSSDADKVKRFLSENVSPSKKGDMDCVAGLLSLSKGNWR